MSDSEILSNTGAEKLSITDDIIATLLSDNYQISRTAAFDIKHVDRQYSTNWTVTASDGGPKQEYFVKHAGERAEKQAGLSQRADRIFHGQAIHASPEAKYIPGYNIVTSRRYPGSSLASLMAAGRARNPVRWYHDVSQALALAGAWLRHYHSVERQVGAISHPLMRYMDERRDYLGRLPADSRAKLIRLVEQDLADELVVTHGDFTPGNIMSDGETICVVDFGIKEWTEMSQWWDVATLLIAIDRYFLFSRSSPVYWMRPLLSRLKSTFWSAYANVPAPGSSTFLACAAVRHFSFACPLTPQSLEGDPRARWHLAQLTRMLDQLPARP